MRLQKAFLTQHRPGPQAALSRGAVSWALVYAVSSTLNLSVLWLPRHRRHLAQVAMGKRYFCDYCDRSFQDNLHNRKKHLNGLQHLKAKKSWYDMFRGGCRRWSPQADGELLASRSYHQTRKHRGPVTPLVALGSLRSKRKAAWPLGQMGLQKVRLEWELLSPAI